MRKGINNEAIKEKETAQRQKHWRLNYVSVILLHISAI